MIKLKTMFYFIFILPNAGLSPEKAIIGEWRVMSNYIYYSGRRNDNPVAHSISFHFKKDNTVIMRYMGHIYTGTYRVRLQKHLIMSLRNAPKHRDHSGIFLFAKNKHEAKMAEKALQSSFNSKSHEQNNEGIFYVMTRKRK